MLALAPKEPNLPLLTSVSEVLLLRISGIFLPWRCSCMPCTICRFSCSIRRQLWLVFAHFNSLAPPALHFHTSCRAFCFLFSGASSWSISDSQLVFPPATFGGIEGWETVSVTRWRRASGSCSAAAPHPRRRTDSELNARHFHVLSFTKLGRRKLLVGRCNEPVC
jgi:hypothetical protein